METLITGIMHLTHGDLIRKGKVVVPKCALVLQSLYSSGGAVLTLYIKVSSGMNNSKNLGVPFPLI